MRRVFIGAAWPYANGPQHIGQLAGNTLPADIFARFERLRGSEVLFVSGSDMHGTPVTVAAEAQGVPPSEIARRFHEVHAESFRKLGIQFDLYTHTETETHVRTAQEVFLRLLKRGFLVKREARGAYCPKHQRFLPDRYLTGTCPNCGNPDARGDECDVCSRVLEPEQLGNPRCRLCGTPAEFRPTEHFYLDLPSLAEPLARYHDQVKGSWRPSVRRFTDNFLAEGLHPRAITRDISWGVPVPLDGYPTKRLYVWFEAVIGYLSASQRWAQDRGDPEAWKPFWEEGGEVQAYYFMGKDNITFHTIFWPAMLLGVGGLRLPDRVEANEHMQLGGRKLSKSRAPADLVVALPDLLERYEPDRIRFYAAYHAPQNHDTQFDPEEFAHEGDQILADQWGNLVQRTLTLANREGGGRIPAPPPGWEASSSVAGRRIAAAHAEITGHLAQVELKEALDRALEMVRETNRLFHEAHPWSAPEMERRRVLYETLWTLRAISWYLTSFLPFSSEKVLRMLGEPGAPRPGSWEEARVPPVPGTPLGALVPLFPKAEPKPVRPETTPPSSRSRADARPNEGGEPPALEIRAGRVLKAGPHPQADRLFVLEIDLGEATPRTLVAGLRSHYRPEELEGRTVAVLANLAPRKLRGVTSQGMVLAAEGGEVVAVLLAPDGTPPGTPVEGFEGGATISHEEFSRMPLLVARVVPAGEREGTLRLRVSEGELPLPSARPPAEGAVIVRPGGGSGAAWEVLFWRTGEPVRPDRDPPVGARVR